jgi:DNA-binding NarL/FixJ family response regulator
VTDAPDGPAGGDQGGRPGGLTAREEEVVRLVAQGRPNREVAAALGSTERAAARHVEHILQKLQLQSRAQLAVWAAEHGLGPWAS